MKCKINYYYKQYKNELALFVCDMLSTHKKDIINAFVEYFGEKYRTTIEERYESITFIFWVTSDSIFRYIEIQKLLKEIKLKKEFKTMEINSENIFFLEKF